MEKTSAKIRCLARSWSRKLELARHRLVAGQYRPSLYSIFEIRNLNGRMGEFAFFADALTDYEISEIYNSRKS